MEIMEWAGMDWNGMEWDEMEWNTRAFRMFVFPGMITNDFRSYDINKLR